MTRPSARCACPGSRLALTPSTRRPRRSVTPDDGGGSQSITVANGTNCSDNLPGANGHGDVHERAALGYSGEFPRRRLGRDECGDRLRQRFRLDGHGSRQRLGHLDHGHGRGGCDDHHVHDRDRSLEGNRQSDDKKGGRLSRPLLLPADHEDGVASRRVCARASRRSGSNRPWRAATATAWVRLLTPIFPMIRWICVPTVFGLR